MIETLSGSAASEMAFPFAQSHDSAARNASDAFSPILARRRFPEWVREACEKLLTFRQLDDNWDSYRAAKASARSIEVAQRLMLVLGATVGIERPAIGLTPAGNVAFSWEMDDGQRSLDLEISGTGVVRFVFLDESDSSHDQEGTTTDPFHIAALLTEW